MNRRHIISILFQHQRTSVTAGMNQTSIIPAESESPNSSDKPSLLLVPAPPVNVDSSVTKEVLPTTAKEAETSDIKPGIGKHFQLWTST